MNLPYTEELEIEYLGRLFDNTSECYKFFWFKGIMTKVLDGKTILSYDEIVNEMIADAWYMVTEYHLNLGPRDTLETLVHYIQEKSGLKSSEKRETILTYIKESDDKEIAKRKRTLTLNVPYRLQAPFMENLCGKKWNVSEKNLAAQINREKHLIYYINTLNGPQTTISVQEDWIRYIVKNQEIIKGWLEYNMILYLQRRNPSVPGIADKLYPPQERKLEKVKKYWKLLHMIHPIQEIYGDVVLDGKDISIDHFVPWSYVAHDEFWNLHPTTKSINSSKSNRLPDWDAYFPKLAELEYFSYDMMWRYEPVRAEFMKCSREHLNNEEIRYRIYREGLDKEHFRNELKSVIQPVYQSAQNCGFGNWVYHV